MIKTGLKSDSINENDELYLYNDVFYQFIYAYLYVSKQVTSYNGLKTRLNNLKDFIGIIND